MVAGEEEKKKGEVFVGECEEDVMVKEVKAPCAKRPRAPLTVTKATILAAIDRGDAAYLRANRLTSKKTVNMLFANTRDTFATAEKDSAGRKRLVSATTLARAIYHFAAAPTEEAAILRLTIVKILLKECGVRASSEKDGFLHFIMTDVWLMANKTPEVPNDPSRHSPLKRRWLLARLLLEADATWLNEKGLVVEALMTFIACRRVEFYGSLLADENRMKILADDDEVQDRLRVRAVMVGSEMALDKVNKAFPLP